jgi:peptide/nickel transport system substrate-binding protein
MRTTQTRGRSALIGLSALTLAAAAILPAGVAAQDAEPVSGGTLVVAADGTSFPANLNPAINTSNGAVYIAGKVVETLAEMGTDGLEPRLATSWEGSDDGLTFTVNLREGVTWSDGQPFTSADVKFSAEEAWTVGQSLARGVLANLEGVDTPDPLTAVFRFSTPTPGSLIANALPFISAVIPAHVYQGTDFATNPDNELNLQPVGTGPFVFAEIRPGELIRLTRNPSYWDEGKPYLDEIVFQVLPDASARAAALESGAVHLTVFSGVPRIDLQRLDDLDGISATTTGYEGLPYQITLDFNHRNPILADVAVRKAIRQALDPAFIVDTVFLGFGADEATGPVPQTATDFYTTDKTLYTFDTAAAAAALDAAGHPVGADGTRFPLRLRVAPFFPETVATGEYVKQALEEVGIAVEIVAADSSAAYLEAVYTNHDFDLSINSPAYRSDPAISTTILFQGGLEPGINFSNQWGYANPELDQVIADGLTTIDTAERVEVYNEFQRIVADDLPNISLVDFRFTPAHRDEVQNVGNNPRWAVSNWSDVWIASE